MGFLGISGNTWKKIGKIALKAAPIAAAPFTGGASLLALGAGTGALSGALDGGGWKGALIGGGLGAIPGGGVGGAAAGTATKAGLKEIAKGVAKGAATNFATGTATGLATGQGLKGSLAQGAEGAYSNLGTGGGAGGFGQAAKNVAKQTAMNVGGQYAGQALQRAGVPTPVAAQGANVFSNYLGNRFTPSSPAGGGTGGSAGGGGFEPLGPSAWTGGGGNSLVQQPGSSPSLGSFLPQTSGGGWKDMLYRAGTGALQGASQGGGWQGALSGATQGVTGYSPSGQPMSYAEVPSRGGYGSGGYGTPPYAGGGSGGGSTYPQYPNTTGPTFPAGSGGIPGWEQSPQSATGPQGGGTSPSNQQKPASWQERWGPLIAQGGGLVLGGIVGKKAQENAMQRSPEELAALRGATDVAGQARQYGGDLFQQGSQLLNEGRGYLQKPAQYFQTLLGGNRAAMSQAIAGPAAQITGNYRGAFRNLDQQGIRGAARDVAAADLNRQRVSQIAGLTTGMQPYAAEQLAGLGKDVMGQAPGLYGAGAGLVGQAGNIYGNLLTHGEWNRQYGRGEGEKTATAIGGLARDVGEVAFRRGQQPATPAPPTPVTGGRVLPPQGGTPQAPGRGMPAWRTPGIVPQGTGMPNMPPRNYPFGTGDYDPSKAVYG